jgi:hypothetical protein
MKPSYLAVSFFNISLSFMGKLFFLHDRSKTYLNCAALQECSMSHLQILPFGMDETSLRLIAF